MKKIITAINDPNLNKQLNNEKNLKVICKDIQYKEAILEILSIKKDVDIIIINNNLPGEISTKDLIDKIKEINENIKIIYILEKENKNVEDLLKLKNINNIYYNSEITIKKLIEIINKEDSENELKREIKELKKIVFNNKKINYLNKNEEKLFINKNKTLNKIINKIKFNINKIRNIRLMNNNKNNLINKENIKLLNKNLIIKKNSNLMNNKLINKKSRKIITISGPPNVGKTTFLINLAKINKNKKIIIIDLDINNPDINNFLGIRKYIKKLNKNKINNLLIKNNFKSLVKYLSVKINKKIDLISEINLIIENKKIKIYLKEIFKILKKEYDLILVDIGNENKYEINNFVFNNSDLNIILLEGNLIGISKLKRIIGKYNNIKNFKLIINKQDKYCIDFNILNKIFNYKIVGSIKYNKIYTNLINTNYKSFIYNLKIKYENEYKNINRKLFNF